MFSLTDIRLKDMLTVMTSPPMHSIAIHTETDNTLICTDDLTRLTNAHESSRHSTFLKPIWQDFVCVKF
jgi:hypothetical protein